MYKTRNVTFNVPAGENYQSDSISAFSGIHITDNPLLADSNSASDMLNLYLTTENTLSTRPRLEFIKKHGLNIKQMISVWKVSEDQILYHYVDSNNTIHLDINNQTIDLNNNDIGSNKIRCFKKNDKIYILSENGYFVIKSDNKLYNVVNDEDTYIPTTKIVDSSGASTEVDKLNSLSNKYKTIYNWYPGSEIFTIDNADVINNYYKSLPITLTDFEIIRPLKENKCFVRKHHETLYDYYLLQVVGDTVEENELLTNSKYSAVTISDDGYYMAYLESVEGQEDPNLAIMNTTTKEKIHSGKGPAPTIDSTKIYNSDILYYGKGNFIGKIQWNSTTNTWDDTVLYDTKTKTISKFFTDYQTFIIISNSSECVMIFSENNTEGKTIDLPDLGFDYSPSTVLAENIGFFTDNKLYVMRLYPSPKPSLDSMIYDTYAGKFTTYTIDIKNYSVSEYTNPYAYSDFIVVNNLMYTVYDNFIFQSKTDFTNNSKIMKTNSVIKFSPDLLSLWNSNEVYVYNNKNTPELTLINYSDDYELSDNISEQFSYNVNEMESIDDKTKLLTIDISKYSDLNKIDIFTTTYQMFSVDLSKAYSTSSSRLYDSPTFYTGVSAQYFYYKNDKLLIYLMAESSFNFVNVLNVRFTYQERVYKNKNFTFTNQIQFYNNYWFSYKNKLYNTQYNDPTYIPESNVSVIGDDTDITGFNLIGNNAMCVYKRNKQFVITASEVDDIVAYSKTEMKTDKGNIPFGETILSAQKNYPLQFDDEGVYVLQIPENINTTENAAVCVSERINGKFIGEPHKENILTHNHLYWTYIMIPSKAETKIYIWDSRNNGWYYWTIPIKVVGSWETLKTYDYVENSDGETIGIFDHDDDWTYQIDEYVGTTNGVDEYQKVEYKRSNPYDYTEKQYTETVLIDDTGCVYNLKVIDYIDTRITGVFKDRGTQFLDIIYRDDDLQYLPISWKWESQIMPMSYTKYNKAYSAINYTKQLVQTGFMFVDSDRTEEYSLNFKFIPYRKKIDENKKAKPIDGTLNYIRSVVKRTRVPKFNFLKIILTDDNKYDKLNLISLKFKYKLMEEKLS